MTCSRTPPPPHDHPPSPLSLVLIPLPPTSAPQPKSTCRKPATLSNKILTQPTTNDSFTDLWVSTTPSNPPTLASSQHHIHSAKPDIQQTRSVRVAFLLSTTTRWVFRPRLRAMYLAQEHALHIGVQRSGSGGSTRGGPEGGEGGGDALSDLFEVEAKNVTLVPVWLWRSSSSS
jgi:hypothetical protein